MRNHFFTRPRNYEGNEALHQMITFAGHFAAHLPQFVHLL